MMYFFTLGFVGSGMNFVHVAKVSLSDHPALTGSMLLEVKDGS